ncbi:MAG TPA: hypothetical protein PKI67_07115, partial [bacterium]|nr:hypothetical protein [bacterium]
GTCTFDLQGIDAVLRDITQKYNGESQVYITGFEAGAHLAWAMAFLHPERLKGAIVVAGNFRNRCLNDNNLSFSNDKHFPIVGVVGAQDTDWASGGKLYSQWLEGKKLATQRGYDHIIEKIIPQKGHEPMPKEVLEIIDTFLKANK